MADNELMIRFKTGVSEDEARSTIAKYGGSVRRRMRWDNDDEVMLLVKVDADVESKLKSDGDVTYTERNTGGYEPM